MSKNNVSQMYGTLLQSKDVSLEVQNQVLKYAEKNKDLPLLIKLLQNPSLDKTVEDKISLRGEAEVLEVWASKPNRTNEELLKRFEKEERATLLNQLANKENLPQELYLQFAKLEKPTIGQTLLNNKSVGIEAKKIAASYAIAGLKGSSTTDGRVKELFEKQEIEVVKEALTKNKSIAALGALVKLAPYSESDKVVNHLRYLIDNHIDSLAEWHNNQAIKSIYKYIDTATKQKFRDLIKEQEEKGNLRFGSTEIRNLMNAPDIDPLEKACEDIAVESSDDKIKENLLLIEKSNNRQLLRTAIINAINNENTAPMTVAQYYNYVEYRDRVKAIAKMRYDKEALLLCLSDRIDTYSAEAIFVVNRTFRTQVMGDGVDTRELIKELASKSIFYVNSLAQSIVGKVAPLEVYEYADFATMMQSNPEFVRGKIIEELQGNEKAWQYFENLIPDWENSLPELLSTAKTFAQEEK